MLIGNATDFDATLAALTALMAEWSRRDIVEYPTRVNHLNSSVPDGLNAGIFFNSLTIHDDGAIDQLFGETELDWFLYTSACSYKDKVNSPAVGEIVTPL